MGSKAKRLLHDEKSKLFRIAESSTMKLWEAANISDHQHLAEAPLNCTTPHSKGRSGLPKHGKARDDPGGVGLRFGSRFGQTQGDSPLFL